MQDKELLQSVRLQTASLPEAVPLDVVDPDTFAQRSALGQNGGMMPTFNTKRFSLLVSAAVMGIGIVLVAGYVAFKSQKNQAVAPTTNYAITAIPLKDVSPEAVLGLAQVGRIDLNGVTKVNGALVLTPQQTPTNPVPGQIYFSEQSSAVFYYTGQEFKEVSSTGNVVKSVNGVTGDIRLGPSLSFANGVLSANIPTQTAATVTSVQGQQGDVAFLAGTGISISGSTINNNGVVSVGGQTGALTVGRGLSALGGVLANTSVISSGSANIVVTDNGNGSYTISDSGVGAGGNVALGPIVPQTDSTTNPSISINKTDTGDLLNLLVNGTDAFKVNSSGLIVNGSINYNQVNGRPATTVLSVGGASGAITVGTGLSLAANNLINTGVTSLTGTTNQVTVSGATGNITLTLPQNIASTSAPTFASLSLTSALTVGNGGTGATTAGGARTNLGAAASGANSDITSLTGLTVINPGAALTIGSTTQNLILQGNASTTLTATSGAFTSSLAFAAPTANQTITIPNASGTICLSSGNCPASGVGGAGTVNTIPLFSGASTIADSIIAQNGGGTLITITGGLSVTGTISGNGSGLTSLNGSNISSGTVADGRLSSNVTVQGNAFNGASQLVQTNAGGQLPAISGVNLTALNGSNISSGTVADTRLSTNVTLQGNTFNGASQLVQLNGSTQLPAVSGVLLTNLNGSNISSGTVADTRLTASVTLQGNSFNGVSQLVQTNVSGQLPAISGINLTNLNGSNIASGTVGVGFGGTGATTAGGARTNLGAAASGANSDITSLTGLTVINPGASLTIGNTGQNLTLQGSATTSLTATSGGFTSALVFQSPTANATITVPNATGTVCLSTGNCLGGASGGANTALSNLASVSLNTSLLPGSTTIDLGSNSAPFQDLYIGGTATTNFRFTGVATGARTITVPDASGTLCLSTGNCAGAGSGITGSGTANTLAVFSAGQNIVDSIISQNVGATVATITGDLSVTGTLSGNGSGLTNLNGTNISSGTVADARLTSNVTVQGNSFNGVSQLVQTNGSGQLPAISGVNVTALNGTNISSGTVADARLTSNVTLQGNVFNGVSQLVQLTAAGFLPALNGSALTSLNATNISSGTVAVSVGGTGITSYTVGDLLYASGATTLSALAAPASGQCLVSNGVGVAPSWGSCGAASFTNLTLAGSSGTPQTISDTDTITLEAGSNITTTAGATDKVTIATVNNPTFSGTITASGAGTSLAVTNNVTVGGTLNTATISGGTLSGGSFSGGSVTGGTLNTTSVNGVTTADIIVSTGSYADPSWITSFAKSKVGLSNVENTALGTWAGTTNLTTLGTIASGTWQAGVINDTYINDTLTVGASGSVDWTALNNYPSACGAGTAITTLGDVPTCTAFAASSGSGSYIQNTTSLQSSANLYIQSTAVGDVTAKFRVLGSQSADVIQVRDSADATTVFAVAPSGNVTGGTYNGATITGGTLSGGSLNATAVNGITVADIVLSTSSYADPAWITSLAKSKVGLSNVENTALSTWNGSSNITTLGTITSGAWNANVIADAYINDAITVSSAGTVDWTALNNYPSACSAGTAITTLGDTVTCTAFAAGSGSGSYIQNQNAGQQSSSNFWLSGTGRADTSFTTPLLDTATAAALNIGTTNATQINLNKNTLVTGNLTFASGAGRTISLATPGTLNASGDELSVLGATANGTGAGGALRLVGGEAPDTGAGGNVFIYGGGSDTGSAGSVYIDPGQAGSAFNPGNINIGTIAGGGSINMGNISDGMGVNILNAGTINVGTGAVGSTINLGTGAGIKTVTIGSTNTTSTTNIYGGSGGINLTGTTKLVSLSTAGIVTNTAAGVLGTVASVPVANGGTGLTSYTTGDLLYASGAGTIGKLAAVASGQCLVSNGVGAAPVYGPCGSVITLQGAYNAGSAGDQVIALGSTNNSLIFRNPASSGTSSSSVLKVEQLNTGAGVDSLVVSNSGSGNILNLQNNGTKVLSVDNNGNLVGNGAATGTTGTTEATARTNVTTVTLTAAGSFANNDIIFINNAGQDYYTRIVSGGGTTTLTVSPEVSYDASASVTKYILQNIGATTTDYTTQSNRFFQGYFLGGVVTGAGSTTLSDGSLASTNGLKLQSASGVTIQNSAPGSGVLNVLTDNGDSALYVDSASGTVFISGPNDAVPLSAEMVTNTDFSSAGWTTTGSWTLTTNDATHVPGTYDNLDTNGQAAATIGTVYNVSVTYSGRTQGAVYVYYGGTGGAGQTSAATTIYQTLTASSTAGLSIVASNDFDGTITAVSVKAYGTNTTPALKVGGIDFTGTSSLSVLIGNSVGSKSIGFYNTAIGSYSLMDNVLGSFNVALGRSSLQKNVNGSYNVALGSYALFNNTSGGSNVAIGDSSLSTNSIGQNNSALGTNALLSNTAGDNSAFGSGSLINNTTGFGNTAVGKDSLRNNTTGTYNTGIGYQAGMYDPSTGFTTPNDLNYSTAIGYRAIVQQSNAIVLGQSGTNVGIGTTVPLNELSVMSLFASDNNATASQSGNTVTGTGTSWTSALIGMQFVFSNGKNGIITAVADATHLTLNSSQTVAATSWRINRLGLQVTNGGDVFTQSTSTQAFRVKNDAGQTYLGVDTSNNQVVLGQAGSGGLDGKLVFNSVASNYGVTLVSGATSSNYTLTLPTALGASGDCLKDTTGAGVLGFVSCGGSGSDLQGSYDTGSAGDQVIALTSANDSLIFRNPASSGTDSNQVLTVDQLNTGALDALVVNNAGTGNILNLQDNGTTVLKVTDGGNLTALGAATGTTGTTEATARTNVTTVTLTAAGSFANNDIIFINNAGQDYYTRIVSGGGTTTLTVSPEVSYDVSATVTKYLLQNIGATTTDYTTQSNRFFQGYFLGGVVTGAGSTTLSDGSLTSTNGLKLQSTTGVNIQNSSNSTTAFQVQNATGTNLLSADTTNNLVRVGQYIAPITTPMTFTDSYTTTPSGTLVNNASYVSGQYVELNNTSNQNGAVDYTPTGLTDFDVSFEFWTSGSADAVYYYAANTSVPITEGAATGGYSMYYSEYNSRIALNFNGTDLATNSTSGFNDSNWHTARIVRSGNNFKIYLDGVQKIDYNDGNRTLIGTHWGIGGRSGGSAGTHRVRNYSLDYDVITPGAAPALTINTVTGQTIAQTGTNSTTGFQIQNAAGNAVLNVDTLSGYVGVNTTSPGAPLHVAPTTNTIPFNFGFETGTLGSFSSTTPTYQWAVGSTTVHTGTYAVYANNNAGYGQVADLTIVKTIPAGGSTISWWRNHNGCTELKLYIDGVLANNDACSSQGSWVLDSVPVSSGTHTFVWRADFAGKSGSDAVYIDDISFAGTLDNSSTAIFEGNVSIGSATPAAHVLDVFAANSPTSWLSIQNGSGLQGGLLFNENKVYGIQAAASSTDLESGGLVFDYRKMSDGSVAQANILSVNGTGNVGIGTSNPTAVLQVSPTSSNFIQDFESAENAPMSSTGTYVWAPTNTRAHNGGYSSYATNAAGQNLAAELLITKTLSAAGTVTFWVYHDGGTPLQYYVDGSLVNDDSAAFQGIWHKYSFALSSGTHTLKWRADFAGKSSGDKVFIDDIMVTNAGATAAFSVTGGYSGFGTLTPTATVDVRGNALFRNQIDSTTALQVQNTNNGNLLSVGTSNNQVNIGASSALTFDDPMISSTTGTLTNNATHVASNYVRLTDGGMFSNNGQVTYTDASTTNYDTNFQYYTTGGTDDVFWFSHATTTPSNPNSATGGYKIDFSQAVPSGNGTLNLYYDSTLVTSATGFTPTSGVWHDVRVVLSGTRIKVYYDSSLILDYTDSARSLSGTKFGMSALVGGYWTGSARVRNFTMSSSSGGVVGSVALNVYGSGKVQSATNSTTAFQVQNASSSSLFTVDTTNSRVYVGSPTADATAVLLVADTKNTTGDPSAVDGAMYYNSADKEFRCAINGAWRRCTSPLVAANTTVPGGNTIASTATETNFASNYAIPANNCVPGKVYRVTARGIYGNQATPGDLTIKVKLGTTVVGATAAAVTQAGAATDQAWVTNFTITCDTAGVTGTVEGQGETNFALTTTSNQPRSMSNTATTTIDTTTAQTLQLSAQWATSSATNTITLRQLIVEEL